MSERRRLTSRQMVALVARREVRERLRARSFYVGSGLLVVVILLIGVLGRLGSGDPDPVQVAVVGDVPETLVLATQQVASALEAEVTLEPADDESSARAALDDGDVGAVLVAPDRLVLYDGDVDERVHAILQQGWTQHELRERLSGVGLDTSEADELLASAPLEATTVEDDDESSALGLLAGSLAAILLFLSLQTFGTYVLTGVVEEKSTAVVEVLLVRASASELLAGKVVGIGVAALAQFALAVVAGLVSLGISGVDIPTEVWAAVPMTLVWFLGGFALYSTLFALAGSLVSRQEDAQAAAAPITYALIGAYVLVWLVGFTPRSTAATVLSLLPPTSPMLMPMRMAAGAATPPEVVVALVGLLASVLAAWKLSAAIYEQVLLRRGTRVSWKDAIGLVRSGGRGG